MPDAKELRRKDLATIKPFKALRPAGACAEKVSCSPYDVVYGDEVRVFIEQNPLSFLRVTRAEGDFNEGTNPPDSVVFDRAKQNLLQFIDRELLISDREDAIYIYQLATGDHTQSGVVGCCSIDEYEHGSIKKHEKVRPDKVKDRTEHMLAVGAQTGLILLAFRNTNTIRSLIADAVADLPIYDFPCPGGIQQRIWRVTNTDPWITAFEAVSALYIADGHHRIESAKLARDIRRRSDPEHTGREDYNFVVAGIFPAEDLRILPYNRYVRDLNGLTTDEFLAKLAESFTVVASNRSIPERRREICVLVGTQWYSLTYLGPQQSQSDPVHELDVSILQDCVLGPILGIHDPRTDERIGFVGGSHGTDELERLVSSGTGAVAFSLYPTTMDDLFAVSDMGEIMPPKSTWFDPKLRDGLLIHRI